MKKTLAAFIIGVFIVTSFLQAMPAASAAACTTILSGLKRGSTGAEVILLQKFLIDEGYLSADSLSGYYGALTEQAVKTFQAVQGLEPAGSVGPQTRMKIQSLSCNTMAQGPSVTVTFPLPYSAYANLGAAVIQQSNVSPTGITFNKTIGAANPSAQTIALNVPSGQAWSTADTISFADLSPNGSATWNGTNGWNGSGPATLTLTPSSGMTNLSAGTYSGNITITSGGGSILVPVTVVVTSTTLPPSRTPISVSTPNITVLSPNGGELLTPSPTQAVSWSSNLPSSQQVTILTRSNRTGDVNFDGLVNGTDFSLLAATYGKLAGQSGYNPDADLNADGIITDADNALFQTGFGQVNPDVTQAIVSNTGSVAMNTTSFLPARYNFGVRATANGTTVTDWSNSSFRVSATPYLTFYTLTTTAPNGTIARSSAPVVGSYYQAGTSLALTATPKAGYVFTGWSGALSGNTNPATITIDGNKTVTANFALASTFSVSPTSIAFTKVQGAANPTPATLTINVPSTQAWQTQDTIPFADVSPDPTSGTGPRTIHLYPSSGMTNAPVGTQTSQINVISGGTTIVVPVTLTVTAATGTTYPLATNPGTGGTITRNPNQASYISGASVSLQAVPNSGYAFANWTGDLSGSTNPMSLIMNAAKTVGAVFNQTTTPQAPQITTQPTNKTVTVGQTATFSVAATGNPTPTYQWQKNGSNISGATSASYTTPATTLSDNNSTYRVMVTNSQGSVTSSSATLLVGDLPPPPTAKTLILSPTTTTVPSYSTTGTKAIADWDTVPYQVVNGQLNVGVVAWHIGNTSSTALDPSDGIASVDFYIGTSANNFGPKVSVTSKIVNPHSCTVRSDLNLPTNCVSEYWATVDATLLNDGPVYVNAIVHPKIGQGVRLTPLQLFANSRNTLSQVRCVNTTNPSCTGGNFTTIAAAAQSIQSSQGNADGGTIIVGPGSYNGDTGGVGTSRAYLTVQAASGVSRNQITINSFTGTPTKLIHFEGISSMVSVPPLSTANLRYLWYSNSDLFSTGRFSNVNWSPGLWTGSEWVNKSFFTDVYVHDALDGPRGGTLVRNAFVEKATGAFSETETLINAFARDINANGWTGPAADVPHSDFYQAYSNRDNVIIYGVNALDRIGARGVSFAVGMTNGAVVNSNVNADASSDFGGEEHNVFIKNSNLYYARFLDDPPKFPFDNFVIENSSSINGTILSSGAPRPGVTVRGGTTPPPTNTVPAITTQPTNKTVTVGQTATFSVVATGNPAPTYQWQKNGANISGATSASYTTPVTTLADNNATYRVIVTNSAGAVTSNSVTLTVSSTPVPTFSVTPTSIIFNKVQGAANPAPAALTINVPAGQAWQTQDNIPFADVSPDPTSGTGPRTIHLYPSSGMTNAPVGTQTSQINVISGGQTIVVPVTLTVTSNTTPPAKFIIGDRVQTTANLNVRASASPTGTFLGTQLSGALGTVTGGPTTASDGTIWWNVNYDSGVDGWSIETYLNKYVSTTPVAPAITSQPSGQAVYAGQTATFSVVASGNPAPTYQWQKNGVNISGATSASYTTPITTLTDSGSTYRVIVANSAGTVTSNTATLTVTSAPAAGARTLLLSPLSSAPTFSTSGVKPIANWDTVPYQVVNGQLNVGVVAWHVGNTGNRTPDSTDGIASVDFYIGTSPTSYGPKVSITSKSDNPSSCATRSDLATLPVRCNSEYWVTVDATLLSDGPVYVNAIVRSNSGVGLRLPPLQLYVNSRNTLSQTRCVNTTNAACTGGNFTSIASAAQSIQSVQGNADGGTILLGSGTYDGNTGGVNTSNAMLTIKAAPGASRDQVIIGSWSGTPTRRVRVDGVTMRKGIPPRSSDDPVYQWISNSNLRGGGRSDATQWASGTWSGSAWIQKSFFTDNEFSDTQDGQRGATLIRNSIVHRIGSNMITGTETNINIDMYDMVQYAPEVHGDVWHGYGVLPGDYIFYNIQAGITNNDRLPNTRGINFFDSGGDDVALVNVKVNTSGGFGTSLEVANANNVFIKNSGFTPNIQWNTPTPTNMVVESSTGLGGVPSTITVR